MISTRFGQFSQDKVIKYLYRSFRRNEECRRESEEILRSELPPKTPITKEMIDGFILTKLIPHCIANGTARAMIEEFGEERPKSLARFAQNK